MAPRAKWMTSSDSFQSHPTTLQQSVALHGLEGVLAAAWRIATCWRHPCESPLVAADQEDSNSSAHLCLTLVNSVRTSSVMVPNGASIASAFTTTTKSSLESRISGAEEIASRNRLLRRFLRGFEPIFFEIAIPTNPVPG